MYGRLGWILVLFCSSVLCYTFETQDCSSCLSSLCCYLNDRLHCLDKQQYKCTTFGKHACDAQQCPHLFSPNITFCSMDGLRYQYCSKGYSCEEDGKCAGDSTSLLLTILGEGTVSPTHSHFILPNPKILRRVLAPYSSSVIVLVVCGLALMLWFRKRKPVRNRNTALIILQGFTFLLYEVIYLNNWYWHTRCFIAQFLTLSSFNLCNWCRICGVSVMICGQLTL
jgi:hypothetical protein